MNAIVVGASSDIGAAACRRWAEQGWSVFGTYRTHSPSIVDLEQRGVSLTPCDLSRPEVVSRACEALREACTRWDVLMLAPGDLDPVGSFETCDFDQWEASVRINFTAQLRVVRELLPNRSHAPLQPCVLFFAGGGTNGPVVNYSAYTVSKIALIKMCEILDAEIEDTRFTVLGPGWVKTKIHASTLRAGDRAGSTFQRTVQAITGDGCTPMDRVLDCCDWIIRSDRRIVGGRNFSVVYDAWGSPALDGILSADPDLYKLRRHGNTLPIEPVREG